MLSAFVFVCPHLDSLYVLRVCTCISVLCRSPDAFQHMCLCLLLSELTVGIARVHIHITLAM